MFLTHEQKVQDKIVKTLLGKEFQTMSEVLLIFQVSDSVFLENETLVVDFIVNIRKPLTILMDAPMQHVGQQLDDLLLKYFNRKYKTILKLEHCGCVWRQIKNGGYALF